MQPVKQRRMKIQIKAISKDTIEQIKIGTQRSTTETTACPNPGISLTKLNELLTFVNLKFSYYYWDLVVNWKIFKNF